MPERLVAVAGPMFARKSETLIGHVKDAEVDFWQIQTFKHVIDNRYSHGITHLESKSGLVYPTTAVTSAREIWEKIQPGTDLVAIDEVQFFDAEILPVIDDLLHRNVRVFVAGLPTNFRHEGFGKMPELFAKADHKIELTAVCRRNGHDERCQLRATRTQRLTNGKPSAYDEPEVVVGAEELYEARCHNHYQIPERPIYY